jgi:dihydropteroate synthase
MALPHPISETSRVWRCGEYSLPLGAKTYVMAILNATPDSFSGDGLLAGESGAIDVTQAVASARKLADAGADILDIGGESTRPGAAPVSSGEEMRRVLPLVEALAPLGVPLSVDTTKSEVARRAVEAGAAIINDVSGGLADEAMLRVLAPLGCGLVLMHRRGTPQTMKPSEKQNRVTPASKDAPPDDIIAEVLAFWHARLEATRDAGIDDARLCFDAGFGFGKSLEENLEIVRRGRELSDFGFPTLSATSRKSTLARVLAARDANGTSHEPAPESDARLFATAATTALAINGGCDIVRVHDAREMAQVARVCDAIVRAA